MSDQYNLEHQIDLALKVEDVLEPKAKEPIFLRFVSRNNLIQSSHGVILTLIIALVVWQIRPDLVFQDTTLTGGDYGGHLILPWYLLHYLLPHFQLRGWDPDWYDGFPYSTFYFPLPSLFVALFALILPYSVAFKLVIVLGIIALPISVYLFLKLAGIDNELVLFGTIGSIAYLFNFSYTIDGGNIASTMAGEYSFEIALDLALIFLGLFTRALSSQKYLKTSIVLLTLIIGSHAVVAIFVICSMPLLFLIKLMPTLIDRLKTKNQKLAMSVRNFLVRNLLFLILVLGVSLFLMSFWGVPFFFERQYMSNMGYSKITEYYQNLFPSSIDWTIYASVAGIASLLSRYKKILAATLFLLFEGTSFLILNFLNLHKSAVIVFSLPIAFVFLSLFRIRAIDAYLSVVAIVSALLFRFGPNYSLVYNGRYLPFYFLSVFLLGSISLGEVYKFSLYLLKLAFHRGYIKAKARFIVENILGLASKYVFAVVVLGFTLISLNTSYLQSANPQFPLNYFKPLASKIASNASTDWLYWNFSGLQAKSDYKELKSIVALFDKASKKYGCGRTFWEYSSSLNSLGTTMALMGTPLFTNNCILSEEGLLFESSATTPFHFLNQAELSEAPDYAMSNLPYSYTGPNVILGVKHLQLLGVKYFLALSSGIETSASKDPDLKFIGQTGPWYLGSTLVTWKLYLVLNSPIIEPLKYYPNVMENLSKPIAPNLTPWTSAVLNWYLYPPDFKVELLETGPNYLLYIKNAQSRMITKLTQVARISNVELTNQSVSFRVSKIGTPILVKISYFPNWHVQGAQGPFRAAPNLMVVIPTSHFVRLYYGQTKYDILGKALSASGAIAFVVLILWSLRSKAVGKKTKKNENLHLFK